MNKNVMNRTPDFDNDRTIIATSHNISIPFDKEFTFDDFDSFNNFMKDSIDKIHKYYMGMGVYITSFSFYDDSYYSDTDVGIRINFNRFESDQEVDKRLKEAERKRIKAEKAKAAKLSKIEKQLASDRELYEKLKKKLGYD